jgi:hypothetical protein
MPVTRNLRPIVIEVNFRSNAASGMPAKIQVLGAARFEGYGGDVGRCRPSFGDHNAA